MFTYICSSNNACVMFSNQIARVKKEDPSTAPPSSPSTCSSSATSSYKCRLQLRNTLFVKFIFLLPNIIPTQQFNITEVTIQEQIVQQFYRRSRQRNQGPVKKKRYSFFARIVFRLVHRYSAQIYNIAHNVLSEYILSQNFITSENSFTSRLQYKAIFSGT